MTTATYAPTPMSYGPTPQLTPYGFWGDIAATVAPVAGRIIGGALGNEQFGGQVGTTAGQLAQRFLPFQVSPFQTTPFQVTPYQAVTPFQTVAQQPWQAIDQTQIHPMVAQQLQQQLLQQQLQQQLVQQQLVQHQIAQQQIAQQQIAQQIIHQQLQQQAAQQQLAPYGFWGDVAASVAPVAGRIIGGALGSEQLGSQIGTTAGQLAQRFLPFQAGPMPYVTTVPTMTVPTAVPQLAPYGLIGGALGTVLGGLGGGALGGLFGSPDLGRSIGTTAGGILGGILPFSTGVPITPQAGIPTMSPTAVPVPQYAGQLR